MKIKFYASIILLIGLLGSVELFGQTTFNAVATGDWNVASNWDQNAVPDASNSDAVVVANGYQITVPAGYDASVKTLTVDEGGILTVSASGTLDIVGDGLSGADLTVLESSDPLFSPSGIAEVYGTLSGNNGVQFSTSSSTLVFYDGSTYNHKNTTEAGSIPSADWGVGSTVLISGYTTPNGGPLNLNQSRPFHHFTWNTPNMDLSLDLKGTLTGVQGNLTFISTGIASNNRYVLLGNTIAYTLTVGGNLSVQSSAMVYFAYNQTSTVTLNVGGNLDHSSSKQLTVTSKANFNLDIAGDLVLSGASTPSLELMGNTTSSPVLNVYVAGDLNVSSGIFKKTDASGTVNLIFDGSTAQSLTSGGQTLYNTTVNGSGGLTLNDATDINGNLTVSSSLNPNNQNLNVLGNIDFTGGTFTPGSGLFTLDGADQSITSGGADFGNISLAGSGTKTIQDNLTTSGAIAINPDIAFNSNTFNISLGGNWENNGTFNEGTGTVTFTGTGNTITGTNNFYNLNVNSSSASNEGIIRLTNILTLGANATFDADGPGSGTFSLMSTATRTASIARIPDLATVTGSVNLQRHIPGQDNVFYYLANSIVGATLANWDDESASPGSYYYNEAVIGTINDGYTRTVSSTSLTPGQGFAYNMRNTSPVVLQVNGSVKQKLVDFTVSYSSSGDNSTDGWNLIGNPYPSTIDWLAPEGWNLGSSLNGTAYVPDTGPDRTLTFVTYSRSTDLTLNNGGGGIASGQAFWIKADNNTDVTLSATEAVKVNETTTALLRKKDPQDYMILALNQGSLRDETAVVFRDKATDAYDPGLDSEKMRNSIFNLSSLTSDNIDVAISVLPWFSCANSIQLNIHNIAQGNYSLDFTKLGSFTKEVSFTLLDNYNQNTFSVSEGAVYEFQINTDAASGAADRFALEINNTPITKDLPVVATNVCIGEPAKVRIANTETDAQYVLVQNGEEIGVPVQGNGNDISLALSADNLLNGENTFQIMAKKGECLTAMLNTPVQIFVADAPAISHVEDGKSCGAGSMSLKAYGAPENGSYRWYSEAEAENPIEGAISATFGTPELNKNTTYYVSALNSTGCESTERVAVKALIIQVEAPQITEESGILLSSSDIGNQWFKNGIIIEGATNASYSPEESGNYAVRVTTADGCKVWSNELNFILSGFKHQTGDVELRVMPNPVKDFIKILYANKNVSYINAKVYQANGLLIQEQNIQNKNPNGKLVGHMQMGHLNSGLYYLKVQDDQGNIHYARLIKE